jgi:uncharacterized membrane protein YcaP (DUF421 family)
MPDLFDQALGLSLKSEQLGFGHMAARAVLLYLALIVLVRVAKKRFLGQATAFDYILVVLIGAVAGRAMTGGAPYFASLFGLFVLVAMHWVFSATSQRSQAFSYFIKGHATTIIKEGKLDVRQMAKAHMSSDDLEEDLREKGVKGPSEVQEARLERSGKLSVIKKKTASELTQ